MPFADNFFDYVYAVSTLEHIGLLDYHFEDSDPDGDIKVMKQIARVIRTGGRLIVTVPYGQSGILPSERVYDEAGLLRLFSNWRIKAENYYRPDESGILRTVKKSEASQATLEKAAIALFCLELLPRDQK